VCNMYIMVEKSWYISCRRSSIGGLCFALNRVSKNYTFQVCRKPTAAKEDEVWTSLRVAGTMCHTNKSYILLYLQWTALALSEPFRQKCGTEFLASLVQELPDYKDIAGISQKTIEPPASFVASRSSLLRLCHVSKRLDSLTRPFLLKMAMSMSESRKP
jgi:hypothetical protein